MTIDLQQINFERKVKVKSRLLLVSFAERGTIVRIISARPPDRYERKRCEEENI
jgi:uncharacterized DUF497 family protein